MKTQTPYEMRGKECSWDADEAPDVVCFSVGALCLSSPEAVRPALFSRRRTSSRSLRLLLVLLEGPGALTPSFKRRERMNQRSLGM